MPGGGQGESWGKTKDGSGTGNGFVDVGQAVAIDVEINAVEQSVVINFNRV